MGNSESKVENAKTASRSLGLPSSILDPQSSFYVWRWRAVGIIALLVSLAAIGTYALGRWQWWSKAPEESGEFHWQEAHRLIAERELSEARTHLQVCLDKWPLNAEVHFLMARCARRESDFARARVHLFAADQLQWPHDQIVFEFQLQQAQTGNLPPVESLLWNYLNDERPDEELVFEALAQGYFVNNSYGKIINMTALWLERYPDAWVPRLYRGHAFYLERSLKQAIEEYRRVLEVNPDQELAQIWLATALMDSGQFQDALRLFQEFVRNNPGTFQALYGAANCQLSLGNTQAAGETLQGLLAIDPNNVKAIFLQAKLELAQENPQQALTWLRRAERLAPRELDINHTLAIVLRRLNRIEEAEKYQRQQQEILNLNQRLKDLTQELRRNPESAPLLFQIGQVNRLLEHDEEAYDWFQAALRIDPNHRETQKALQELTPKKEPAAPRMRPRMNAK